jgi:hypothetical protein
MSALCIADIQNDYERSGTNAATRGKITLILVVNEINSLDLKLWAAQ